MSKNIYDQYLDKNIESVNQSEPPSHGLWDDINRRVEDEASGILGKKRKPAAIQKPPVKKTKREVKPSRENSSSSSGSDIRTYFTTSGDSHPNNPQTSMSGSSTKKQLVSADLIQSKTLKDHDSFFDDSADELERQRLSEMMSGMRERWLDIGGCSSFDGDGELGKDIGDYDEYHKNRSGSRQQPVTNPNTNSGKTPRQPQRNGKTLPGKGSKGKPQETEVWQPRISESLEKIRRHLGNPPDGERCFGCSNAPAEETPTCWESWSNLRKMVVESIMRRDPVELAKRAHEFFTDKIRNPANKNIPIGGSPVPDWHPFLILEHFTKHMQEPSCNQWHRIRQLGSLLDSIYDHHLWEENEETGERRASLLAIKSYTELLKHEQFLYKQDPKKMFGASAQFGITIESSLLINPKNPLYVRDIGHASNSKITPSSLSS